jgi:hypothetical protein
LPGEPAPPTEPKGGEYDRGERKQAVREFRSWLLGCTIVVLLVILLYVVYAILLFASGWHG